MLEMNGDRSRIFYLSSGLLVDTPIFAVSVVKKRSLVYDTLRERQLLLCETLRERRSQYGEA